jgi:hypothetical protein
MSVVHERSELVEPLLLAHLFRGSEPFRASTSTRRRSDLIRTFVREHWLSEAAIGEGLQALGPQDSVNLDRDEPLHRALRDDATRWLVPDGDHWSLRVDPKRPGHEIVRWRGLTMLMPPSLVVAGAQVEHGARGVVAVRTLPDSVAPSTPVGHLHVHLGPLLPFETLWGHLWMAFIIHRSLDVRGGPDRGIDGIGGLALPSIAPKGSCQQPGLCWQWLLELAFLARAWLECRLEGVAGEPTPRALRCFGRGEVDVTARRRTLLAAWGDVLFPEPRFARWAQRKAEGFIRRRDQRLRAEVREARGVLRQGSARPEALPESAEEIRFMAAALARCDVDHTATNVGDFAQILYQYLRVKVALYGRLVVDPWTTGLRHFLDVVRRDKPYTAVVGDEGGLDCARRGAARLEAPLEVDPLEVHIPPGSWLKLEPRRDRGVRHAWILSFVRSSKPANEGWDGLDGAKRWRNESRDLGILCRAVRGRMEQRASVLGRVRAVSLMDWERNGPVWLFEPHLRRLVDASRRIASRHPGLKVEPLRTTFHVGEDFDHILSGLRQIYEPFAWELIGRNDRIGHALALGMKPSRWTKGNPRVRMRPWDRLLDVGFVAWAFADRGLRVDAEGINRLRASAAECFAIVFRKCKGDPLEAARHLWLGLPVSRPPGGSSGNDNLRAWARKRVAEVMDDPRVGRRALARSLIVDPSLDLPVIRAVHRFLHRHVSEMHVAIEVNPSSNLLVGGFKLMFEQPVFHLDHLPIVIGADDPLTFATSLHDDYAYAWAGMVLAGEITTSEATKRLEEIARNSVKFSFSGPHLGSEGVSGSARERLRAP